jgi:ABC-2 type transport system permease protein
MGALISLVVGIAFLGVALDLAQVNWAMLALSMLVGLSAVVGIALAIAAVCMQTRQDSWHYPEAVVGALFLVSGAVFPLGVLPPAVQAIGLINPLSWWIEGVRRALLPSTPTAIGGDGSLYSQLTGASAPSGITVIVALLLTGAIVTLAAMLAFRRSERRAKDLGLIDQTTGS